MNRQISVPVELFILDDLTLPILNMFLKELDLFVQSHGNYKFIVYLSFPPLKYVSLHILFYVVIHLTFLYSCEFLAMRFFFLISPNSPLITRMSQDAVLIHDLRLRVGEMALWINCLLWKHEDLNSDL